MLNKKKLRLYHQIIIILLVLLVMPLSIMGYYFYKTTLAGMEKIGEERAVNSLKIAQSLLDNNATNLLSITKSNSNWEDFRLAVEENDIAWIRMNIDENLTSVEVLDFIITTDNAGNIMSAAEEIPGVAGSINLKNVFAGLDGRTEFSGLIETSEGIAFIAAAKVTDEEGLAPPAGNLVFGSLLTQANFDAISEALEAEIGILDTHRQVFASIDTIEESILEHGIPDSNKVQSETRLENDTLVVHANKQILDIANEPVGAIHIDSPMETSSNVISTLRQIAIFTSLIFILLIVILTIMLKRQILSPLKYFTSTLEQVAAGSPVREIPASISSHAERNILRLFDQLHKLSFYDYLTNLPNRRSAAHQLEQLIQKAENSKKVGVIYLDLDRFKNINDSLGHHTGDELLKLVAARLSSIVPPEGVVARLGGDEFTLILPNVHHTKEIQQFAEKISDAFTESLMVGDYDLFVTSSMGISVFPDDGQTVESLFMNADVAMYRAKEQGRNKFEFYSSGMNATSIDKLKVETALQKALENDEFYLAYQPKVCIKSNRIAGMEALIRWQHPEMGLIPPNDFIPIAEEIGLINPIGQWVLKAACKQNKLWQEKGISQLKVAVNISARQFQHENFLGTISSALEESGLDPKWLELEITESTAMNYANETIETLKELDKMGISVALDDFGTGYSSLSYLKRFPIKSLKIDRSFIKDIEKDSGDLAIAKSIITLGQAMNFEVVAEGVENRMQLEALEQERCDTYQGYYFSPPVPAEEFEQLVLKADVNV